MSDDGVFDEDQGPSRRKVTAPYTSKNPIPTVQNYAHVQEERKEQDEGDDSAHNEYSAADRVKNFLHIGNKEERAHSGQDGHYGSENLNLANSSAKEDKKEGEESSQSRDTDNNHKADDQHSSKDEGQSPGQDGQHPIDTTESTMAEQDPRKKRKAMKKRGPEGTREVTDPVTHLPVTIHDYTQKELDATPTNFKPWGSEPRTATGLSAASKSESQLNKEQGEIEKGHEGMQKLFPPPSFESLRAKISRVYSTAFAVSAGAIVIVAFAMTIPAYLMKVSQLTTSKTSTALIGTILVVGLAACFGVTWFVKGWLLRKIDSIWEDEVWQAARTQERQEMTDSPIPESTMWLNSILGSIWPLINPDLFSSIADTLEDVMQASLPKVVRMVAVTDVGQGSQALRILGVRWLPTGAAAKSVSMDGKVKSSKDGHSDRTVPGEGEVEADEKDDVDKEDGKENQQGGSKGEEDAEDANVAEGLEGESGDFMNLEIGFSYRATSVGKSLSKRAQNAHLFLVFYLPGNLPIPVWVSIEGIIGTLRVRCQTSPDPPFINLATLTLIGQPRASISCVPLVKKAPNIMDLPLISSFVQSSVDAALAEYVAPKSLTLDLKQMLTGDDFKKDTNSRGVIYVKIKSAEGMKEGDSGIPFISNGSSDCYVSCGWAKFSKPVWSTRVIESDLHPVFHEHCMIPVGQEELNAQERLRIQLWDSDRTSADDDLGRIEVDIKELMRSKESKGKMWQREDSFIGMDGGSSMPGKLSWEVGYFGKVKIQEDQLVKQQEKPEIRNLQQLKDEVSRNVARKLREASDRDTSDEANQQKAQDYAEQENELICAAPPPKGYLSGMLSIQIHNATGLEVATLRKQSKETEENNEMSTDEGDLPSPYCNVIVNGRMIYRTRTKPKNSKPFFNASTERFIRDWRNTEVIIAVRDSRVHEKDALMGIVYLPLEEMFSHRSQYNDTYPLAGGIGYGRIRISMVFRALDLKLPPQLRGWDFGTVEITEPITPKDIPEDLKRFRLKLRTSINKGKMHSNKDGHWESKKNRPIRLAVQKRYSSPLVIEFRKNEALKDKTPAYAILWLKDIPDDEDITLNLPVWRGEKSDFERAQANCLEKMGERAGSIEVKLKFFSGLSEYHRKIKDPNVTDVMECLDAASDNKDMAKSLDDDDGSDTSSSSSDDDDAKKQPDSKSGPVEQVKDYKEHHKTLHRKHRGLMQWKAARTGDWFQSAVKDGIGGRIKDTFKHNGREPDVETEV